MLSIVTQPGVSPTPPPPPPPPPIGAQKGLTQAFRNMSQGPIAKGAILTMLESPLKASAQPVSITGFIDVKSLPVLIFYVCTVAHTIYANLYLAYAQLRIQGNKSIQATPKEIKFSKVYLFLIQYVNWVKS